MDVAARETPPPPAGCLYVKLSGHESWIQVFFGGLLGKRNWNLEGLVAPQIPLQAHVAAGSPWLLNDLPEDIFFNCLLIIH